MNVSIPFDHLPDDAWIKVPIGAVLAGKSKSAAYADAKAGRFPPIEKLGHSRSSGIRVGELRRYLKDPSGYKP